MTIYKWNVMILSNTHYIIIHRNTSSKIPCISVSLSFSIYRYNVYTKWLRDVTGHQTKKLIELHVCMRLCSICL